MLKVTKKQHITRRKKGTRKIKKIKQKKQKTNRIRGYKTNLNKRTLKTMRGGVLGLSSIRSHAERNEQPLDVSLTETEYNMTKEEAMSSWKNDPLAPQSKKRGFLSKFIPKNKTVTQPKPASDNKTRKTRPSVKSVLSGIFPTKKQDKQSASIGEINPVTFENPAYDQNFFESTETGVQEAPQVNKPINPFINTPTSDEENAETIPMKDFSKNEPEEMSTIGKETSDEEKKTSVENIPLDTFSSTGEHVNEPEPILHYPKATPISRVGTPQKKQVEEIPLDTFSSNENEELIDEELDLDDTEETSADEELADVGEAALFKFNEDHFMEELSALSEPDEKKVIGEIVDTLNTTPEHLAEEMKKPENRGFFRKMYDKVKNIVGKITFSKNKKTEEDVKQNIKSTLDDDRFKELRDAMESSNITTEKLFEYIVLNRLSIGELVTKFDLRNEAMIDMLDKFKSEVLLETANTLTTDFKEKIKMLESKLVTANIQNQEFKENLDKLYKESQQQQNRVVQNISNSNEQLKQIVGVVLDGNEEKLSRMGAEMNKLVEQVRDLMMQIQMVNTLKESVSVIQRDIPAKQTILPQQKPEIQQKTTSQNEQVIQISPDELLDNKTIVIKIIMPQKAQIVTASKTGDTAGAEIASLINDVNQQNVNNAVPKKAASEISEKQVVAPMKAPESPMKAPESPMKAPESPMKAPESPMKAPESPMKAPESPMKAQESPIETMKSPTTDLSAPLIDLSSAPLIDLSSAPLIDLSSVPAQPVIQDLSTVSAAQPKVERIVSTVGGSINPALVHPATFR
jgi:hypothetical protein